MPDEYVDLFEQAERRGKGKDNDPYEWEYLTHFHEDRLGLLSAADYLDRRRQWSFLLRACGAMFMVKPPLTRRQWDYPPYANSPYWTAKERDYLMQGKPDEETGERRGGIRQAIDQWDNGLANVHPGHDWDGDAARLIEQIRMERPGREIPDCWATEPVYAEVQYRHEPGKRPFAVATTPKKREWLLEDFARNDWSAAQIDTALRDAPLYWDFADLSDLPLWVQFMAWLSGERGKIVSPNRMPKEWVPLFERARPTERYPLAGRLSGLRLVYFSEGNRRDRPGYGYMRIPGWEQRLERLAEIAKEQQRLARPTLF